MLDRSAKITLLGFDFGLKRIGVAVGQTASNTAKSLTVIAAKQGLPHWPEVDNLVEQWQPQQLVVGCPLNMDGTCQDITQRAQTFAEQLERRYTLPVFQADERLTTIAAKSRVFEQEGFKGLQNAQIDAVAAQIILEVWLKEYESGLTKNP